MENPAVAVYGYPTQLTPQEVLGADMAPFQQAIQSGTKQQADVNAMMLDSALQQRLAARQMQGRAQIQQMRDKMLYDRLQGMEKMKIDAIRQQGMNKQIQDALNNAQDLGVTPPSRQGGMDDQGYLDSINQVVGDARTGDIKASSGAVKNSLRKLDELAQQKNQLENSVLPDAQKIALAKVGSLQQWVQQQGDPDLLASYQNAAKNNLPVPQDVAQAYQTYASGVFESTKYDLLGKAGKQKQYDAVKAESDLQNQLIHNSLWGTDRSGRVAPKPYASQIINDATTQYEAEHAKAADDAATQAAKSGDPGDAAAATQADLNAKRAAVMASAIRQRASVDTTSLAGQFGQDITGAGKTAISQLDKIPNMVDVATAMFGSPGAAAPSPADVANARAKMISADPNMAAKAFIQNLLPVQRVAAPQPRPAMVAPTNGLPALPPVNVLQNPAVQNMFQSAQTPVAPSMTPGAMGIGGLSDISPADMMNAARYSQMLNTEQ